MFRAEDGDISLIYFRQISDATTENLREIFSVSPNSAAAERVFSKLKSMFGDQQMEASRLGDIIQTANCD